MELLVSIETDPVLSSQHVALQILRRNPALTVAGDRVSNVARLVSCLVQRLPGPLGLVCHLERRRGGARDSCASSDRVLARETQARSCGPELVESRAGTRNR